MGTGMCCLCSMFRTAAEQATQKGCHYLRIRIRLPKHVSMSGTGLKASRKEGTTALERPWHGMAVLIHAADGTLNLLSRGLRLN